jgi:hypothetical protein
MWSGNHFGLAVEAERPKAAIILPYGNNASLAHRKIKCGGKTALENYRTKISATGTAEPEGMKKARTL